MCVCVMLISGANSAITAKCDEEVRHFGAGGVVGDGEQ